MNAPPASRRKSLPRSPQRRSAFGGTLLGVFIGLVVGLGLAATVAYWLMKNNPALPMPSLMRDSREPARETIAKAAKAEPEKPRFDFYKILPGADDAKAQAERRPPDRGDRGVAAEAKDRAADKAALRTTPAADAAPARVPDKVAPVDAAPAKVVKASDRFWLQAGSFSTEPDAENLRARLALSGWEASVQEGALPDKSIRYRVRLGPYDNANELGRMKSELSKRGFDVAVIRY
jgi:cell division protein FtsN